MTQCCGKVPSQDDVKNIRSSIAKGNSLQGDIGERVASEVAINDLNLNAEFYDAPGKGQQGFDSVYRDGSGKLVIVEAKFTSGSPTGSLKTTNHGRQGSVDWVRHNAELMCNPTSSQYSPDNAKIGAEILKVGPENVRVVLVHTHVDTLQTTTVELR